MSQGQSVARNRALENIQTNAHKLAKGISQRQDLLTSVADHESNVYVEESYQRRRFLFFSVTETRRVTWPQIVVQVLKIPPIYIIVDDQLGGQLAQRFEQNQLHIIDPDILHTETVLLLDKELQTLYSTLFPD
jgi:hypothetical protein